MEKKLTKVERAGKIALGTAMVLGEWTICFFNGFGIGRILKEKNIGIAGTIASAVFVGGIVPTLLDPVSSKAVDLINEGING